MGANEGTKGSLRNPPFIRQHTLLNPQHHRNLTIPDTYKRRGETPVPLVKRDKSGTKLKGGFTPFYISNADFYVIFM
jgi:hypothetical protein